ncbi:hypothetical protein PPERSA_06825 [Pseudocohnilembus persalinus]|uniref:C2H2-type domain-containing protein n=1 Tax=Pseudocohnilembus persalinus TaxID=266149 RepID=A0A0V0QSN2_PSEPJ|nr:hypothetical protein PPERSA_06825 [Pseudocohnilembus persalinus]|eukprot:KRX05191.1 hypothetical protein PPERSA_06825 [Pseudocohnilembus persalinus]
MFECKICSRQYSNIGGIVTHQKQVHGEYNPSTIQKTQNNKSRENLGRPMQFKINKQDREQKIESFLEQQDSKFKDKKLEYFLDKNLKFVFTVLMEAGDPVVNKSKTNIIVKDFKDFDDDPWKELEPYRFNLNQFFKQYNCKHHYQNQNNEETINQIQKKIKIQENYHLCDDQNSVSNYNNMDTQSTEYNINNNVQNCLNQQQNYETIQQLCNDEMFEDSQEIQIKNNSIDLIQQEENIGIKLEQDQISQFTINKEQNLNQNYSDFYNQFDLNELNQKQLYEILSDIDIRILEFTKKLLEYIRDDQCEFIVQVFKIIQNHINVEENILIQQIQQFAQDYNKNSNNNLYKKIGQEIMQKSISQFVHGSLCYILQKENLIYEEYYGY